MAFLLRLCWRLTVLRASPGDMPPSALVLAILLAACAVTNVIARFWLTGYPAGVALSGTLLGLLAWSLLLAVLLRFKSVSARFRQAFASLLGVDLMMTLLSAGPLMAVRLAGLDNAAAGLLPWLFMLFFVWDMLAKGAIYREALNTGPTLGNLLALCVSFGFMYLDTLLMPDDPARL